MSLFAMGINSMELDEERMELARIEFESLSALFDNIVTTCENKCIPPTYGEPELNKGEMACIDRCVSKFFKTNLKVGEYLRNTNSETLSTYNYTKNIGVTQNTSPNTTKQ